MIAVVAATSATGRRDVLASRPRAETASRRPFVHSDVGRASRSSALPGWHVVTKRFLIGGGAEANVVNRHLVLSTSSA